MLPHILALLINSTEAGNLLRGNDALHAILGARTRARVQLVLVTMMFSFRLLLSPVSRATWFLNSLPPTMLSQKLCLAFEVMALCSNLV